MDVAIGFLTFGTLGFVLAFAYISARVAEKQRKAGGPKSLLSKDGAAEYVARKTQSA